MRHPYGMQTPQDFVIRSVIVSDELDEDEVTARYTTFPPEAISAIHTRQNAETLRSVEYPAVSHRSQRDLIIASVSVIVSLILGGIPAACLAVLFWGFLAGARWWWTR